jgi:tagatose 6-phosphate kinase
MILVVSPNLAVDYTLHVERLVTGEVQRSITSTRQAGGKGVNASRALKGLGEPVLLCGFVGGHSGRVIEMGLSEEGLPSDLVSFEGENRTCVILLAADGQATVVNEPGPRIEGKEPLLEKFKNRLSECRAVALMGSLPPGLPHDTFAEMVTLSRKAGVPCLVDTSGVPLQEALAARPTYAKPNLTEAEELLDEKLSSEEDWLDAVERIKSAGAEVAIITLGLQGAVAAGSGVRARLSPAEVAQGNATGAGDAMAAGLLAGHVRGGKLQQVLAQGMAAAAASVRRGYGRIAPSEVRPEAIRWKLLR